MIYLDYNATTPVDERVISKILPFFSAQFGNAASAHPFGQAARQAVDHARATIAKFIGASAEEIIFTSGATESCNLAIKGIFDTYKEKGNHILTVATEHSAVLDTCKNLEALGAAVTYLPVDQDGLLDLDQLAEAIRSDTILVAVMFANNETGVLQPIEEIGRICHEKGTLFFCDGTQAIGKIPVDVQNCGIDLLAFSGHKIYAPKGTGGLYIRRKNPRVVLTEQIHGGGHERGLRSGTLNVPGIIGMAAALDLFTEAESSAIQTLRDRLETALLALPGVKLNGHPELRIGQVSNLSFEAVVGKQLLGVLNTQLAISSGSACSAASAAPSHVLLAMGVSENLARTALRFSLGRQTTLKDIEFTIHFVTTTLEDLRRNYSPS